MGRVGWPVLIMAGALGLLGQTNEVQKPGLSLEQKEEFLRKAEVIKTRHLRTGVTESLRATLKDGTLTHDAHVQSVDIFKPNFQNELQFRDSYRYNVAAWELAKVLGLTDMMPPSVQRKVGGNTSAVTWWIDDVLMDETTRMQKQVNPPSFDTWNRQMDVVRVFDQLIYNSDRNTGNIIITKDWKVMMIDHTRAFRRMTELRNEANLRRCDRQLMEKMKSLNRAELRKRLRPWLQDPEIDGILGRRDLIVAHFEAAVKTFGEGAVYFDRPMQ